ncbi:MAG: hypothetical protein Q9216_006832 [Gyalolechia sp. 2 TL-2023]
MGPKNATPRDEKNFRIGNCLLYACRHIKEQSSCPLPFWNVKGYASSLTIGLGTMLSIVQSVDIGNCHGSLFDQHNARPRVEITGVYHELGHMTEVMCEPLESFKQPVPYKIEFIAVIPVNGMAKNGWLVLRERIRV